MIMQIRYGIILILCFVFAPAYGIVRTNNLPDGFLWQYMINEQEPSPRTGQFWRDGIFLDDKIIILNTHNLIALDTNGNELWVRGLPAENPLSEAKIHRSQSNEILIVITDAVLRINTDTGELIEHYGYNVARRSAFQFTELLPRQSVLFQDTLFVFLGPELLAFNTQTLSRSKITSFNTSPKTIPLIYDNRLLFGFNNGFVELFDSSTTNARIPILFGSSSGNFSVRQPIIYNDLIFIPTSTEIYVYKGSSLFAQTSAYTNAILSKIDNNIWLREHNKGHLIQINEILIPINQISFESPKTAHAVNAPLIGYHDKLIHFDSIAGKMVLFSYSAKSLTILKEILTEDFLDNPPLQMLDQKNNLLIIGAFDGLYLLDINKL
ncbi:MAG: hypothetical protein ACRCTQ_04965 [Brevinemataceae bacterium]